MNQTLIDLAVQRGRLIERITSQRQQLGQDLLPIAQALQTTDHAIAVLRDGVDYLQKRPALVAAAVGLITILRPQRVWRWSKRGFVVWRAWRVARQELANLGWVRGSSRR